MFLMELGPASSSITVLDIINEAHGLLLASCRAEIIIMIHHHDFIMIEGVKSER